MTTTIRVLYALSQTGRRAALAAGVDPSEVQVLTVEAGTPEHAVLASRAIFTCRVTEQADRPTVGIGMSPLGLSKNRIAGYGCYEHGEGVFVDHTDERFDAVQALPALLEWLAEDEARIEKERLAAEAKRDVVAARIAAEKAETGRISFSEHREAAGAWLQTLTEAELLLDEVRAVDYAIVAGRDCGAAHYNGPMYSAVKAVAVSHTLAVRNAELAEQAQWIAAHGSMRLKACMMEQIECSAAYKDERLAVDRPGWRFAASVRGESDDPRNPPVEAFDLLATARETDPKAELRYWVAESVEDEYGEATEPEWRGYVCRARFLGRFIILGDAPEEGVISLDLGFAFGCRTSLVETVLPGEGRRLIARPTQNWEDFPIEVVAHHDQDGRWIANTGRADPGILSTSWRKLRDQGAFCLMETSIYGHPIWVIPEPVEER